MMRYTILIAYHCRHFSMEKHENPLTLFPKKHRLNSMDFCVFLLSFYIASILLLKNVYAIMAVTKKLYISKCHPLSVARLGTTTKNYTLIALFLLFILMHKKRRQKLFSPIFPCFYLLFIIIKNAVVILIFLII